MSNVLDRTPAPLSQEAERAAASAVWGATLNALKPKQRAKLVQRLEAEAQRLETFEGCRLPANVVPLRGRMSLASEVQRQERAEQARAIRDLIGKVF